MLKLSVLSQIQSPHIIFAQAMQCQYGLASFYARNIILKQMFIFKIWLYQNEHENVRFVCIVI